MTPLQSILTRLSEIEATAEAATKGPWEPQRGAMERIIFSPKADQDICDTVTKEDAKHIATMDPPTTLALCRALRAAVEDMNGIISRVQSSPRGIEPETILSWIHEDASESLQRITSELEKI